MFFFCHIPRGSRNLVQPKECLTINKIKIIAMYFLPCEFEFVLLQTKNKKYNF